MNDLKCPICNNTSGFKKKFKLIHAVYQCKSCKLELCPDAAFNINFNSSLNEKERKIALEQLRKENFRKIVNSINRLAPNAKGLEVGCGYGWFLEVCKEHGIHCSGIEPETRFNEFYQVGGFNVRNGFYPDVIEDKETYDFIIFNDVLEHIPDVEKTMKSNYNILRDNGILIINIPVQEGLFYFFSKIAYRLGYTDLLNRMWQFNFHSPHLYYFKKENIQALGVKSGFVPIESFPLNTIKFSDISNRIKQDRSQNIIKYFISLVGTTFLYPFTKVFPDTYCFLLRKY